MRSRLWLTEGVRMEALCADPAELITSFCRIGVEAADFRELGQNRYSFLLPAEMADRAIRYGSRCGAELSVVRRRGLLHFLRRFRRRAFLLLIPLPLLLAFLFLSTCIWEISITGNETLSRAEILTALEAVGVYPGVSGLRLDNPQIRSRMQAALGKLSWCTVQVHGSRALVVVRERRLPPKIIDESLEREVAASRTGTIESMNVLEGKALVKKGDTVLQGQTLITGVLTDRQGETRRVHAMGRVMAWTWYERTLMLPLAVREKAFTGKERTLYSVKIGDLRLNFYNDSSISPEGYDKITTENRAAILGLALPVSVITTECREYLPFSREIEEEEGFDLLKERLLLWLRQTAPKAELVETWFRQEVRDGILYVHMLAQCREDIAAEREIGAPSV